MNLEAIRAQIAAAIAKANTIVEAADKENAGQMTEEQQKSFDALMQEADKLNAELERRERLARTTAAQGESMGRITAPAAPKSEADKEMAKTCGFADVGDFARSVAQACMPNRAKVDDRLTAMPAILGAAPTNPHREGGSTDGFMVPPQIRDGIWEVMSAEENLLSKTDNEPTDSNSVAFLRDESTTWGAGGIVPYWTKERGQIEKSRISTAAAQLQLHKLTTMVEATEELLEDAPRLTARLATKVPKAFNWKIDDALMYGDGAGMPLGWTNSGAQVVVSKESGQVADTVNVQNIINMYSRMLASSLSNAFWLMNVDVLPQLMTMTIPGGGALMWTPPSSGLVNAPGGLLLGRPIVFSEHSKTLGDKNDIQFVDPKGYYAVTKRSGLKYAESMHLYFDYDTMAFRWTIRIGGQPYLSAPVSPNNGVSTKSHFVTLEDRA